MWLIVGLGNPGEKYLNNRHNVGFQCLKHLADRHGMRFDEKLGKARIATGTIGGQRVVLAKPFTFMNLSGEAVSALARWYKIEPSTRLLVVYDELDLPFGTLRLRQNGSAGGHNGMKSIIQQLGGQNFARLRFGIGRPPAGWEVINFVLGNWNPEESKALPDLYDRAADAIELTVGESLVKAMNRFNQDKPKQQEQPAQQAEQGNDGAR